MLGRPELTLFEHLLLCKNSTPQGSPTNFEFRIWKIKEVKDITK